MHNGGPEIEALVIHPQEQNESLRTGLQAMGRYSVGSLCRMGILGFFLIVSFSQ